MRATIKFWLNHLIIFLSYLLAPVSILLRALGVRMLEHGPVIGNLCTQLDAYAKEIKLGRIPRHFFVMYSYTNRYFCSLWKAHFFVVVNPLLQWALKPLLSPSWMRFTRPYFSDYPDESFYAVSRSYYEQYPTFTPQTALLKIPEKDQKKGEAILRKWGIGPNDWFVCFYAREPGFYDQDDQKIQGTIRNVDVRTYKKALEEVINRGGFCIRMGSHKMAPLPQELTHPQVIDYPKTEYVSDFMDIFLSANCRFMLTCSSGISSVPGLFGVPILMTNVIPLHISKPLYPKDLSILKRYYSRSLQKALSFEEMLSLYVTDQVFAYYYEALSLEVIDNTEEEIFHATCEMFDRLDGRYVETEEEIIRQESFSKSIPRYLFCKDGCGKLGSHFLRTNEHLLTEAVEARRF